MLHVFREAGTGKEWATFTAYDNQDRALLRARPSAVSGYNELDKLIDRDPVAGRYDARGRSAGASRFRRHGLRAAAPPRSHYTA